MVRMLIPACASMKMSIDASDALAIAICHAHTAGTTRGCRSAHEHLVNPERSEGSGVHRRRARLMLQLRG
jgi:hypothetical protein